MSETSWVLQGVDARHRQRAIDEAERLGVPLAAYLTEVVLKAALAQEQPPEAASGHGSSPPARVDQAEALADTTNQLNQTLQGAGAFAERDAVIGRLVEGLTAVRKTVEARLHESAGETRLRIQAAFADVAQRTSSLAERITGCERNVEQIRVQITDLEDSAHTPLKEDAVRAMLAQAHSDWDARFDALVARLAHAERDAAESHRLLRADNERVEAGACAALEKLADDRDAEVSALRRE